MINIIQSILKTVGTNEEKTNILRELLQVLILRIVYNNNYFRNLSFVGGTALRLLYDLRRFSEDLDFSLIKKNGFSAQGLANVLKRELMQYGLAVDVILHKRKAVQTIDIKFRSILQELHLSSISSQKLFIRFEIDTNPPGGWDAQVSMINRVFMFTVTHFDLASMYALKLHACFYRKYTKGRDFYDLIWYFSKNTVPNFVLLNNAIRQTEKKSSPVTRENFKDFLEKNIMKVDFPKAKRDVERFLEDKTDLRLFNRRLMIKQIHMVTQ